MAVGTPYKVAADVALTTASTNANITTNAIAHSGDTLFVWVANRLTNATTISTVTGYTGGTPEILNKQFAGGVDAISVYRVKLTADIPSGTTLAVTLAASSSRKCVGAFAVPGLADANVDQTDGGTTGTTGNPTTGATPSAQSLADAISIAFYQHTTTGSTETGTPAGGYTEIGEKAVGASSWSAGYVQYKVLSATAVQGPVAYTPSLSTTNNYVGLLGVWVGVSGSASTDADTASLSLVASATETHEVPDSGTAALTAVASAAEIQTDVEAAIATLTLVASAPSGSPNPVQGVIDAQFVTGTNTTDIVLTVPAGMHIPVGDTIVIPYSSTTQYDTTPTDTHSQTWVNDGQVGAGSAAVAMRVWRTTVTTQFDPGDTITLPPNAIVAGKIAAALWLSGVTGLDTAADNVANDATAAGATFTETSPSALVESHAIVLHMYAIAGDKTASVAPSSGWANQVKLAHSSGTIITLVVDTQEFTAGGTPSATPTWTGNANYASVFLPYALPNVVVGESAQFSDAATATESLVASGVEIYPTQYADSATATLGSVMSATELAQFVDAAVATLSLVASATEVPAHFDATTATLSAVASAAETEQTADSATATLALVTTGTEVPAHFDAATAALGLVTSGVEATQRADSAPVTVSLAASGVEQYTPNSLTDSDTAFLVGTASAVDTRQAVDSATATINLVSSATEVTQRVDAATASVGLAASAIETKVISDAATATVSLQGSAAEVTGYADGATATLTNTASGTDLPAHADAATANLTTAASAGEIAAFADTNIIALTFDASGSTENQAFQYGDTAQAALTLVAGGSEAKLLTTLFVDDEFGRTVSNGLGTASPLGGAYVTNPVVAATKFSVNGSRAVIVSDNTPDRYCRQPTQQADTDSQITFAHSSLPVTKIFKSGLWARLSADGQTYYHARIQVDGSGNVKLRLEKIIAGTNINLVPEATILTGYTANTDVKARFIVQGTQLQAKIWYAANGEPSSWTQQVTDADIAGVGDNAFTAATSSQQETTTTSFDSYMVQGPGTDSGVTYFDTDTPTISLVATGAQRIAAADASTATLTLASSGVDAIGDFGTAQLNLDASTSSEDYYVDTAAIQFLMRASAVEAFSYQDSDTAFLSNVASAAYVELYDDVFTAELQTFAFDLLPNTAFVDGAVAALVLDASPSVDVTPFYDYFLATSLDNRWTTVAFGFRWSSTLDIHITTGSLDRFSTVGVGFDPRGTNA